MNPVVNISEAPVRWIRHVRVEAEVEPIYEVIFSNPQPPHEMFVTVSANIFEATTHTVASLNTPKHTQTKLNILVNKHTQKLIA